MMHVVERERAGALLHWIKIGSGLLLALALGACGGGGGADPAATPAADGPVNTTPTPHQNGAINAGLSGRIYFNSAGGFTVLDLASGYGAFYSDLKGLKPSASGQEMLNVVSGSYPNGQDEVRIRNEDGRTVASFWVNRFLGGARFSPDSQTISAWWGDVSRGESEYEPKLTLFSRDGQVLNRVLDATAFAWMPDGRTLIAVNRDLFLADSLGQSRRWLATLPQPISLMAASPDGKKVALQLPGSQTHVNESHIWIMNLDGSGLRQMTYSSFNEKDPVWIGNGDWLLVREGVLETVYGHSGCPDLYAVPADADMVELTEARPTRAHRIYERTSNAKTPHGVCPFSAALWAPDSQQAPARGQLPVANGQLNRGLQGTLFFGSGYRSLKENHSWQLNLITGAKLELSSLIDGFDASNDGLWLATAGALETDSHGWTSELIVRELSGTTARQFQWQGNMHGVVRFSPNKEQVLMTLETRPAETYSWTTYMAVSDLFGQVKWMAPNYQRGDWLPQGGLVLADAQGLYVVDEQFENPKQIFSTMDGIQSVRVSPNGQWIAFGMLNRIWVIRLDGTGLRRLTQSDGIESHPEWSPDGRYVAVAYRKEPDSTAYSSYAWVVAADAQGVTVGQEGLERDAFPIRDMHDGQPKMTWMTSRFSWR